MRLYRNHDMTGVGQWTGTQDDANKDFGRGQWKLVEVPTDKAGLIAWLNVIDRATAPTPPPQAVQHAPARYVAPSYTETSCSLDEAWEVLSLPRKLHFAALAMEDARDHVARR